MDSRKYLKKGEIAWVGCHTEDGTLTHIILTKNALRDRYYLIDVRSGKRKEVASSVNPLKLEGKIDYLKEKENE